MSLATSGRAAAVAPAAVVAALVDVAPVGYVVPADDVVPAHVAAGDASGAAGVSVRVEPPDIQRTVYTFVKTRPAGQERARRQGLT